MTDLANRRRFISNIDQMTNRQILEAIWGLEAAYKCDDDHTHDHRRYLKRKELETVFFLAQRRAELKSTAR